MRISAAVATIFLAAVLGGCATVSGTLPEISPAKPTGTLRGGAAKVDITPPPGFPMGGHSVAGEIARGHWTRLHARSVFIEAADGARLALVAADLWSIPAGLADRVAELIGADEVAACRLARDQLVIAATHTHQSPGNFSSSSLYNSLASKSPGFDADLFEFFATRIAAAVRKSCEQAIPAILRFGDGRVRGLARNRSMHAFLQNDRAETESILAGNADLPVGCLPAPAVQTQEDMQDLRAFRAVDPTLHTLWLLDSRDPSKVIGVAAFTAVHATALNHSAPVYSSDLFGAAATLVERKLAGAAGANAPVAALFNGAEGDVSPAWCDQTRADVLRLGALLGESVLALRAGSGPLAGTLDRRFEVRPLAGVCLGDDCTRSSPGGGAAALGGAEDGRTFLFNWGCREGVGIGIEPIDAMSSARAPGPLCLLVYGAARLFSAAFLSGPRSVPMGVYRLGDVVFVTLPGEFTTVLGRRIADAVRRQSPAPPRHVVLVGLANEYLSYFTTPQEYRVQSYEGGSMLYGPASGVLIGKHAEQLASALSTAAPRQPAPATFAYPAGLRSTYAPAHLPRMSPGRIAEQVRESILGMNAAPATLPSHCWRAPAPAIREALDRKWEMAPRAAMEILGAGGAWSPLQVDGTTEDDSGMNLVTLLAEPDGTQSLWCTLWMPAARVSGTLRFGVTAQDGSRHVSKPFSLLPQ